MTPSCAWSLLKWDLKIGLIISKSNSLWFGSSLMSCDKTLAKVSCLGALGKLFQYGVQHRMLPLHYDFIPFFPLVTF